MPLISPTPQAAPAVARSPHHKGLTGAPPAAGRNGHARLHLPSRAHIRQVDHSDPLPYYYAPLVSRLYRRRLEMALDLLGPGPYERILEAGYGSGILLPSLAGRTTGLFGVDLHREASTVCQMLAAETAPAALAVGDVCALAYADAAFDAVICVSTLEHLPEPELARAVAGLRRILRPGGIAVIGVPASGWLMDILFRAIGFAEIGDHHVSTHGGIERQLRRHFHVEAEARMPAQAPRRAALYTVFRCRR